ncbi:MAG: DNA translocase FtsK 4TM domain-containing protein [Pseudomonadota bacterium]
MARKKYKIKTKKKSFLSRLVPEPIKAFIARRIVDTVGIASLVFAAFLSLSFISYSANDPSLNTAATSDTIQNWMGSAGATFSDLFLQTLGLASIGFALCFAFWGASLLKRRSLSPFWMRSIALIASVFVFSIAFSRLPSGDWLPQSYLGGSIGGLIFQNISDSFHALSLPYPAIVTSVLTGMIGLALFLFAAGIRKEEAIYAASITLYALKATGSKIMDSAIGACEWVRHYNDETYTPKERKPKAEKPVISKPEKKVKTAVLEAHKEPTPEAPTDNSIQVVQPAKSDKASKEVNQQRFQLFEGGDWELPSTELLQEVPEEAESPQMDENALRMNAELLQNVLADFNVKGDIVSIHPGPVVTLYELEPAPGTKTSRVIGLSDDIARSMSAISVRAAVVPGRNVIGIELPNKMRQTVYFRSMIETRDYEKTQTKLPLILGKDIGGKPVIADLARMPHLLVAGTTGSGKSVAVNTMILSLLYRLPPEKCRFIMIDPKMLELSVYDDIPHLLTPVVTEPGKAVVALKWAVAEMEERYRAMSKLGVRNIDGYNARLAEARKKGEALMRKVQTGFDPETGKPTYEEQPLDLTDLPYIVVIVDEFADLMLVAGKEVENTIQRLAQMARAAGIHIIMATQRPSVDVITGVIKANFPTRISFQVTSKIDSRTILGDGGAEQLLGMGDMLYMAAGGQIKRVHGPFSSDEDVENVVNYLKAQGEPLYLEDITEGGGDITGEGLAGLYGDSEEKVDELYDKAVEIVARERKASTSFIQRHLQIGYNRAARIVEEMEKQGVIGPANHVGKREILVQDLSEVG